jgi:uncharacterized protein YozE (UPF0346 family)
MSKTPQRRSFFDWLSDQRGRGDRVGDFAIDAWQDGLFPRTVSKEPDLITYMERRGAGEAALEAAREAWAEYGAAAKEWVDPEEGMDWPEDDRD